MPIERSEVKRIARLARLRVDDAEAERLARDLERIVAHIDRLAEVVLPDEAVAPTYFDTDVHREDRTAECLPHDEALANASETDGTYFLAPQIVDKSDS